MIPLTYRNIFAATLLSISSATALAAEICGVTDTLLKSSFEAGEIGSTAISPSGTPISLTVAEPTDNSTVGAATIRVAGTYTGPPNTGISVNGAPAFTTAGAFLSGPVRLQVGANTLNVVLTGQDGQTTTVVRHVTYDTAAASTVQLAASLSSSLAPLKASFDLSVSAGPALQPSRLRVDYNGDGLSDLDTTNIAANLSYTYLDPGLYTVTATVTLDDTDPMTAPIDVTASAKVLVQHPGYIRLTLCQAFGDMRDRLIAGQIASAALPLHPDIRSEFQTFWTGLGGNLATTASNLGTIVDGTFSPDSGELLIARPVSGSPGNFNGFRVHLERDRDGVWRIVAM